MNELNRRSESAKKASALPIKTVQHIHFAKSHGGEPVFKDGDRRYGIIPGTNMTEAECKRAIRMLNNGSYGSPSKRSDKIILSPAQYDWMKADNCLPENAVRGVLTIPGYSRKPEKGNEWYWAVGTGVVWLAMSVGWVFFL